MKSKIFYLLVVLALSFTACGPQPATLEPTSLPTEVPMTRTPFPSAAAPVPATQTTNSAWVEYRDPRYGYGLALPCYWTVSPTPMLGMFATMSARSYTDEFLNSNSDRGNWIGDHWPAGAMNLNVVAIEGIDPSLSMINAIRQFYTSYSSEQSLLSVDEISFEGRTGYVATVAGGLQGGETVRIVYFSINPNTLAAFTFSPSEALNSSDAQAILYSFTLAADQPVSFPPQNPSGPPGGGLIACVY